MTPSEQRNHAMRFLAKAQEYLASAQDNLELERFTVAAGDAIHAGICAKDAIMTVRTGVTGKGRDHATAAKELGRALAKHPDGANAEKALRELVAAKSDVEYGTLVITATRAEPLLRRAASLVELAEQVVRLGR